MKINSAIKLTLIFFYSFNLIAKAQVNGLDSTYNRINKISNDSLRKERLINHIESLILKKANHVELAAQIEKDALKNNDLIFLGNIYSRWGFSYISIGDYMNAFPLYIKAEKIFNQIEDPTRKIRVYQDMMWIQLQLKNYDAAKSYLDKALDIAISKNIKAKEAEVYNFFGILYDSQQKYKEAILVYRKALSLNKQFGTKYNEISTLTNLGISLRRSSQFPEALVELEKAYALAKEINHHYYKQATSQNLAELTFQMGRFDIAEKHILEALSYKKSNEFVLKRGLFENLVKIYKHQGEFKKALLYSDSLLILNNDVFDQNKVEAIRVLQTKYDVALKDKLNTAQQLLNIKQANDIEKYKNMIELASRQRKIDELNLNFQKKQSSIRSSYQYNIIQRNKLLAKKDSDIAARKLTAETLKLKSIRNRGFILYGVVVVFFILMIIAYLSYKKNKRLNDIIVKQRNELEKINAAKDKIFSIIGHDLRSPFNTLKSFTHLIDDKHINQENIEKYNTEIKGVLSRTTILLDNLLNWSNSQMQGYKAKFEELSIAKIINKEISLMVLEAEKKGITVNNNLPNDLLISTDKNMMSVVIRNLLSNAIKFSHVNGVITFNYEILADKLMLKVSDNGVGMKPHIMKQFNSEQLELATESTYGTHKEPGTGLGLFLIKSFIKLVEGDVKVKSLEESQGTEFTLVLPL